MYRPLNAYWLSPPVSWRTNANEIFNADPNDTPMETDEQTEEVNREEEENEHLGRINLYEETLMDPANAVEFAPGEGEIPKSILTDEFCEELSFPSIWYGHARTCAPHVRLSFEDYVNSEIRRQDRRATKPEHLLFVHKKSQLKQLCSNVNIALKKSKKEKFFRLDRARCEVAKEKLLEKEIERKKQELVNLEKLKQDLAMKNSQSKRSHSFFSSSTSSSSTPTNSSMNVSDMITLSEDMEQELLKQTQELEMEESISKKIKIEGDEENKNKAMETEVLDEGEAKEKSKEETD